MTLGRGDLFLEFLTFSLEKFKKKKTKKVKL